MRIRKRQLPFPISSFSPLPLSDPHLQLQLNHPIHATWDSSAILTHPHSQHSSSDQHATEPDGAGGDKPNQSQKGGILVFDTVAEVVPPSSPSNQDGRWCEGEKAIPLKKRRGSFDRRGDIDRLAGDNSNKKMKPRMKTKMNKKCSSGQNDNEENEQDEEEEEERKGEVTNKKRGRGGAVMEGSRCSRVNGRGWRCCQQTLVGYSLCEHHLGKGRLRSMTSVRTSSTTATTNKEASSSSPEKQVRKLGDSLGMGGIDIGEGKDEKKPPLMTAKKRMKLGMVKARSISSLLGQTNTQNSVAHTQNSELGEYTN